MVVCDFCSLRWHLYGLESVVYEAVSVLIQLILVLLPMLRCFINTLRVCTSKCGPGPSSGLTETLKGIVHFEIKIWYLSAYPKGIQDVGVFFSSVDPILMFLGQTVLVCQSYNGRYRSLSL